MDYVVDGDTLDVRLDGQFARVRTVQIDAPESSSTRYGLPDRCGAPAKRFAESLTAPGRIVTLQIAGNSRTDAYGRLLAIIHLGDAKAITWQQEMVRSGWAELLVYHGNTTPLLPALRVDAAYAKSHRLGIWAVCDGHFHDPETTKDTPSSAGDPVLARSRRDIASAETIQIGVPLTSPESPASALRIGCRFRAVA